MISDCILEHPELLLLKRPAAAGGPGADPRIAERVSEILLAIERGGETELRRISRELDGWDPPSFELTRAEIAVLYTRDGKMPSPRWRSDSRAWRAST